MVMRPETLKILNSLRSDVSEAIFHNLDALDNGGEFVPVPAFDRPAKTKTIVTKTKTIVNVPTPAPEASPESIKAANAARARISREKKRAEKIAAGWIPPEQRASKNSPERLEYFRQKQAERRAAKKQVA